MFEETCRVFRFSPEPGRRILVVSDIHANLPYFRGLLEKVGFCQRDYLILDGDFLEKGEDSLGMLRFVMELCKKGNCLPLRGNCDEWADALSLPEAAGGHLRHYMDVFHRGLFWEMLLAVGVDPETFTTVAPIRAALEEKFGEEFRFLASLPHAIVTDREIFVHSGLRPDLPVEEQSVHTLTKFDNFRGAGYAFDKWVVVGHWPVVLYGQDRVCANPIIDRDRHIISIDGGCVLKDDGQLNALILPESGCEDFSFVSYDPFPTARVLDGQEGSERSYYIRWGDSRVQVLERGEEFCRCRHVRTGYEMDILTRYLFTGEEFTGCNDCTDYVLPLCPGDEVSVVETCSRGYFVKHRGVSGWYYGRLEFPGGEKRL